MLSLQRGNAETIRIRCDRVTTCSDSNDYSRQDDSCASATHNIPVLVPRCFKLAGGDRIDTTCARHEFSPGFWHKVDVDADSFSESDIYGAAMGFEALSAVRDKAATASNINRGKGARTRDLPVNLNGGAIYVYGEKKSGDGRSCGKMRAQGR